PHMAGGKLISEARRRAAAALGVAEDAISDEAGRLSADGRSLTLGELARQQSLAVDASFKVSKVTYAGCGVAVIADVEAETGFVKLRRVVVGADVGRAVNPRLVEDQLVGGVAFGSGTPPTRACATTRRARSWRGWLSNTPLRAGANCRRAAR